MLLLAAIHIHHPILKTAKRGREKTKHDATVIQARKKENEKNICEYIEC